MKTKKKILTVLIVTILIGIGFLVVQFVGKEYTRKNFFEETNQMIKEKGYSYEEIASLEDFQIVDKEYDNAVLERFNKIQGYLYEYEDKNQFLLMWAPHIDGRTEIINQKEMTERAIANDKYEYQGKVKSVYKVKKYIILPSRFALSTRFNYEDNRTYKYYAFVDVGDMINASESNEKISELYKSEFAKNGPDYNPVTFMNNDESIGFEMDMKNYQNVKDDEIDNYIELGILKLDKNRGEDGEEYYSFVQE